VEAEDDAVRRLNEAVAKLNECLQEAREIRARLMAAASRTSQPLARSGANIAVFL